MCLTLSQKIQGKSGTNVDILNEIIKDSEEQKSDFERWFAQELKGRITGPKPGTKITSLLTTIKANGIILDKTELPKINKRLENGKKSTEKAYSYGPGVKYFTL